MDTRERRLNVIIIFFVIEVIKGCFGLKFLYLFFLLFIRSFVYLFVIQWVSLEVSQSTGQQVTNDPFRHNNFFLSDWDSTLEVPCMNFALAIHTHERGHQINCIMRIKFMLVMCNNEQKKSRKEKAVCKMGTLKVAWPILMIYWK